MSYYLNHPEFFNGPIRLTKEEINDPLQVVSSFFEDYSLSEIRDHNGYFTLTIHIFGLSP